MEEAVCDMVQPNQSPHAKMAADDDRAESGRWRNSGAFTSPLWGEVGPSEARRRGGAPAPRRFGGNDSAAQACASALAGIWSMLMCPGSAAMRRSHAPTAGTLDRSKSPSPATWVWAYSA